MLTIDCKDLLVAPSCQIRLSVLQIHCRQVICRWEISRLQLQGVLKFGASLLPVLLGEVDQSSQVVCERILWLFLRQHFGGGERLVHLTLVQMEHDESDVRLVLMCVGA